MASTERSVRRLEQTLGHLQQQTLSQKISILHGPSEPPLLPITLGNFLERQSILFQNSECVVFPETGARLTYGQLYERTTTLARSLIAMGIGHGDRIGIMAGNCEQYVVIFFAAARIGAILVVLNNTYTATEMEYALQHTQCKLLFTESHISRHDNTPFLKKMGPRPKKNGTSTCLEEIILIENIPQGFPIYLDTLASSSATSMRVLQATEDRVSTYDVVNLQFTSGSTGHPKAAMLTHHNIINNSRFIGDRMSLTEKDVLCCPPPLFHCFGLVLGLLATMTHGSKIIYPSKTFDPSAVLKAISDEKCTALHGVPAMFETILSLPRPQGFDCSRLRTGIIAGAPVPRPLMERLVSELNMTEFTSSYGLTETSPTCFNAFVDDTIERRLNTVGKILPHAHAKIVDREGQIVPIGQRGELCIAGYCLQKGYWNDSEKTAQAMQKDQYGVTWLRTGDEASFDDQGYCTITGRFKDIIIRGGENIYPLEIEERLVEHDVIERAVVVGLQDHKYGEVVGAFLKLRVNTSRPLDEDIRNWVRSKLSRHKAPVYIFWLGQDGVSDTIPQTGSGKVKKHELRKLGDMLVKERTRARKV